MRRYILFARIFLILSITNFARAAPVLTREVDKVHVDVARVAEDGSAKRWEPWARWLTNAAHPSRRSAPTVLDQGLQYFHGAERPSSRPHSRLSTRMDDYSTWSPSSESTGYSSSKSWSMNSLPSSSSPINNFPPSPPSTNNPPLSPSPTDHSVQSPPSNSVADESHLPSSESSHPSLPPSLPPTPGHPSTPGYLPTGWSEGESHPPSSSHHAQLPYRRVQVTHQPRG